eukprot:4411632-Pyramimonas_sp.AAC.1
MDRARRSSSSARFKLAQRGGCEEMDRWPPLPALAKESRGRGQRALGGAQGGLSTCSDVGRCLAGVARQLGPLAVGRTRRGGPSAAASHGRT